MAQKKRATYIETHRIGNTRFLTWVGRSAADQLADSLAKIHAGTARLTPMDDDELYKFRFESEDRV